MIASMVSVNPEVIDVFIGDRADIGVRDLSGRCAFDCVRENSALINISVCRALERMVY